MAHETDTMSETRAMSIFLKCRSENKFMSSHEMELGNDADEIPHGRQHILICINTHG